VLLAMLKRLLSKIIENEHDSEIMRQKLFGRDVPNYKRLFEQLDVHKTGVLNKNDLAQLINEHGVFASGAELGEIIAKYSGNPSAKELPIKELLEKMASQIF
jgi:Ca2+-binding EF-hand superfamily protein